MTRLFEIWVMIRTRSIGEWWLMAPEAAFMPFLAPIMRWMREQLAPPKAHRSRTKIGGKQKSPKEMCADHEGVECNDVKNAYGKTMVIAIHFLALFTMWKWTAISRVPICIYEILTLYHLHSFSFGWLLFHPNFGSKAVWRARRVQCTH